MDYRGLKEIERFLPRKGAHQFIEMEGHGFNQVVFLNKVWTKPAGLQL
jgi:hypothetical protein